MGVLLDELQAELTSVDSNALATTIVNAPFKYRADMVLMGIGIIVLLIADKKCGQIRRVALSKTDMADGTERISAKPFKDIKVPIDDPENIVAQVIRTGEPQMTDDWKYLFTPALTPDEARLNQAGGGIACSYAYPLNFQGEKGAIIFSFFKGLEQIAKPERNFMAAYSKLISENLETVDKSRSVLLGK
jgi:hypothetical protein